MIVKPMAWPPLWKRRTIKLFARLLRVSVEIRHAS